MNEQGPEKGKIIKLFPEKKEVNGEKDFADNWTPEEIKRQIELLTEALKTEKDPTKIDQMVATLAHLNEKL
jgi:hypothetical protein